MSHLPTCDLLVRNGDCTCPPEVEPDQRERDVAAVSDLYARRDRMYPSEFRTAVADLIAAAREQGRREGTEQAWDEGWQSGALHDGTDDRPTNPYRADAIARGDR